MTTVSNTALDNIPRYSRVPGANTQGTKDLGQDDFLTLMTTQLQNQDPFSPMENGDFLAQMAQFSTVSGIENVNKTLDSMVQGLGQFRVATAASILGQHVLVPGTTARPDENGEIHGAVDLSYSVDGLEVTYEDALTGDVYHTETLGSQPAGLVGFSWKNIPDALREENAQIRVSVRAQSLGNEVVISPSVFARIMSVDMGNDAQGMTVGVEDYGTISSLEINAIR